MISSGVRSGCHPPHTADFQRRPQDGTSYAVNTRGGPARTVHILPITNSTFSERPTIIHSTVSCNYVVSFLLPMKQSRCTMKPQLFKCLNKTMYSQTRRLILNAACQPSREGAQVLLNHLCFLSLLPKGRDEGFRKGT